ncbi:hypothetical protein D7V80_19365 [Corallococcus sp. CA054B]|nr:hypothetical protein D7V80_19365 [Corallococcus sp. CA054B]
MTLQPKAAAIIPAAALEDPQVKAGLGRQQRLEEEGHEAHCGRGQEEAGGDEHVATLEAPQGGTGAAGRRDGQLAVTRR